MTPTSLPCPAHDAVHALLPYMTATEAASLAGSLLQHALQTGDPVEILDAFRNEIDQDNLDALISHLED